MVCPLFLSWSVPYFYQGVQRVAVSRGGKGLILIDSQSCYCAYADIAIKEPVSTIGCGDAMLAGFAVATMREAELTEFLKLGVASATANLFSLEPSQFDRDKATSLFPQILIHRRNSP